MGHGRVKVKCIGVLLLFGCCGDGAVCVRVRRVAKFGDVRVGVARMVVRVVVVNVIGLLVGGWGSVGHGPHLEHVVASSRIGKVLMARVAGVQWVCVSPQGAPTNPRGVRVAPLGVLEVVVVRTPPTTAAATGIPIYGSRKVSLGD